MPPAARTAATTSPAADTGTGPSGRGAAAEATAAAERTAGKAAEATGKAAEATGKAGKAAGEAAGEAVDDTTAAGAGAAGALRQVVTVPSTVARQIADDVVTTVRRPDAVLYLGGLVGLAVLGVLEWPVAAAAGVGLAVAGGVRRSRA